MSNDVLTGTQKEAMRAYHRAWRKTHPDSVKRSRQKFAQKQAERMGLNTMELLSSPQPHKGEIKDENLSKMLDE